MKVNVETPNTIGEEYSKLSPIDLRDEYIDDPFDVEINIKIEKDGSIYINGELMIMLKSIVGDKPTVYCRFNDFEEWDKKTEKMIPAKPSGGISVGVGDNIFNTFIDEFTDEKMWTRISFKELFTELIADYVNTSRKHKWSKDIEKARKYITDSFDEVVNIYTDYKDMND